MGGSTRDGSAGDADYGVIGTRYAVHRRPDPQIALAVRRALGPARTVCNVGAGAGSYEPANLSVVPVEPSATMRAQRPAGAAVAVAATAEALPFADDAFDAAMTTFSVHQWSELEAGLSEMRRVSRGAVAVLTCDPGRLEGYWLNEYAPEVVAVEAARYPGIDRLARALGGTTTATVVPIPLHCADGFNEAYYGRPEALLDREARTSCSAWSFVGEDVHDRFGRTLRRDLDDGTWDRRHGGLRTRPTFEGALVLVVSTP